VEQGQAQLRPQPGAQLEVRHLAEPQQEARGKERPQPKPAKNLIARRSPRDDIAEVNRKGDRHPGGPLVQEAKWRSCCISKAELHNRVDRASSSVTARWQMRFSASRARRYQIPNRRISFRSLFILGTTRATPNHPCGKTNSAKAWPPRVFDSRRRPCASTMSEYMEKHAVSRLIGAPPRYWVRKQGGPGSPKPIAGRRPMRLILFDGVEKGPSRCVQTYCSRCR